MTAYHKEIDELHDIVNKLENLCEERKKLTNTEHACTEFVKLADKKLETLIMMDKIMSKEIRRREKKRSSRNGFVIGRVSHSWRYSNELVQLKKR